jgi:hypothetical protein
MMQKHITKLENMSFESVNNLSIEKLGHFNLFSNKSENGYDNIIEAIYDNIIEPNNDRNKKFLLKENFLHNVHCRELKSYFSHYLGTMVKFSKYQIFATTQRLDVIQAFAEVAQEYQDIEAYYYRLGRSAIPSDNNKSIVSMYTIDELIEAINKNREVR